MTCAFSRLVAFGVLFSLSNAAVAASPFDIVKTYRFIPRLSDVVESGGITGRELDYSVWGKFDLNFGPEVSIPELPIHPSFENVQSWLNPDSLLTYVLFTDDVFGLSRLEGNYKRQNRIVQRMCADGITARQQFAQFETATRKAQHNQAGQERQAAAAGNQQRLPRCRVIALDRAQLALAGALARPVEHDLGDEQADRDQRDRAEPPPPAEARLEPRRRGLVHQKQTGRGVGSAGSLLGRIMRR